MAEDAADRVPNLGLAVACHPEAHRVEVKVTEAKVGDVEAVHVLLYLCQTRST